MAKTARKMENDVLIPDKLCHSPGKASPRLFPRSKARPWSSEGGPERGRRRWVRRWTPGPGRSSSCPGCRRQRGDDEAEGAPGACPVPWSPAKPMSVPAWGKTPLGLGHRGHEGAAGTSSPSRVGVSQGQEKGRSSEYPRRPAVTAQAAPPEGGECHGGSYFRSALKDVYHKP